MDDLQIRRIGETKDQLGESPCWNGEAQSLCWIDALAGTLWRFFPPSGALERHALPAPLGSIALGRGGQAVVVALKDGFGIYDFGTRELVPLARLGFAPQVRFNDGKCDAAGNFIAGTIHADRKAGEPVQGGLYRLRPDGTVEQLADDIGFANGPCFSPDGSTLYLADSLERVVWAYDYDPQGPLRRKREFVRTHAFDAGPDGAAVDAQGCFWTVLTRAAKLARFAPNGTLERVVEVPVTYPTSICFGGPSLDRLYLTSISRSMRLEGKMAEDGGVFEISGLPCPGIPVGRFGGG